MTTNDSTESCIAGLVDWWPHGLSPILCDKGKSKCSLLM